MAKDVWQDQWREHARAWGSFVRQQRELSNLSLRQLADLAQISNPYLSQLERGMHAPSVRVIRSLADALGVPAEDMFEHFGIVDEEAGVPPPDPDDDGATEAAIQRDRRLSDEQKDALLAVYRSYRQANEAAADRPPARRARKPGPRA